jgi:hypothetical protein
MDVWKRVTAQDAKDLLAKGTAIVDKTYSQMGMRATVIQEPADCPEFNAVMFTAQYPMCTQTLYIILEYENCQAKIFVKER